MSSSSSSAHSAHAESSASGSLANQPSPSGDDGLEAGDADVLAADPLASDLAAGCVFLPRCWLPFC
jgi:hypothetical protein